MDKFTSIGRGRCRTTVFRNQTPGSQAAVQLESDKNVDDLCKKMQKQSIPDKISVSSSGGIIPALFTTRPAHIEDKKGTSGTPLVCYTNFIPIDSLPDWNMFQYHISFSPVVDSKMFRINMVRDKRFSSIFGEDPVCDGMILYSPSRLEQDNYELTCEHPRTGEPIIMRLKLTNELSLNDQQCLTVFNLCAKKSFESLGYKQMGRHYYNPNSGKRIEKHKLEIWPGIVAAIRVYEEKLLLCCETSHKLLRMDTVATYMHDLLRRYGSDQFKQKVEQTVIGCSVLTRYNNKTYRVDDILWNQHPFDKFTMADGRELSYMEYYEEQFGLVVKDRNQPMLVSRSKKHGGLGSLASLPDICLIPELCSMTGLTDEMREDRQIMRDLAEHTRVSPQIRAQNARQYLKDISSNKTASAVFKNWNLSVSNDLLRLTARVLPRETLKFFDRNVDYSAETADWSRECRSTRLTDTVPLDQWVMVFHPDQKSQAERIYAEFSRQGAPMRMTIAMPTIVEIKNNTVNDYLNGIKSARESTPKARIVLIVVPNDNKTRYDAIKKWCCLDFPIPSQVVKAQSVEKNTQSVCSKILLQINCKLGGSIWRLDIPLRMSMVIGYDAYHDSANKTVSVGAAVFSIDAEMTRWFSRCALHSDPNQLATNLTEFCRQGLQKFYETNGNYPDKVFLYRDGVGEGHIPVVFKEELPRIQKAFNEINANIKLCFIIVTKRVTLRFFQEKQGVFVNPPPGTLVDSGITKPERYDFYMVPQAVRQGTVTPVSYNVIFDNTGLQPDHLHRLSYKLCHLYYNWQGTIRVPAPCQYAHKLAFLVAQSLHKPVHESLADKLFFL